MRAKFNRRYTFVASESSKRTAAQLKEIANDIGWSVDKAFVNDAKIPGFEVAVIYQYGKLLSPSERQDILPKIEQELKRRGVSYIDIKWTKSEDEVGFFDYSRIEVGLVKGLTSY